MEGSSGSNRLCQDHAAALEGAAVVGLIRLAATGVAVADTGIGAGTGDFKKNLVVSRRHDSSLGVHHGDGKPNRVLTIGNQPRCTPPAAFHRPMVRLHRREFRLCSGSMRLEARV